MEGVPDGLKSIMKKREKSQKEEEPKKKRKTHAVNEEKEGE